MTSPAQKLAAYEDQAARLRNALRDLERQSNAVKTELGETMAKIAGFMEAMEMYEPSPTAEKPRARKRQRALTGHWQSIMQAVDLIADEFTYEDLERAAESIGHDVSRDTLRSQMSLYKGGGLVEATDNVGSFRLTDDGRKAAGITTDDDDAQPSPEEQPLFLAGPGFIQPNPDAAWPTQPALPGVAPWPSAAAPALQGWPNPLDTTSLTPAAAFGGGPHLTDPVVIPAQPLTWGTPPAAPTLPGSGDPNSWGNPGKKLGGAE